MSETIRCAHPMCHVPASWMWTSGKPTCGNHPADLGKHHRQLSKRAVMAWHKQGEESEDDIPLMASLGELAESVQSIRVEILSREDAGLAPDAHLTLQTALAQLELARIALQQAEMQQASAQARFHR